MITKLTPEDFISLALEEANKALNKDQIPVGAILVYEGNIIAKAHNGTSPLDHAEYLCLKSGAAVLGASLQDAVLYVSMEPCAMCQAAISLCNISTVYFGAYSHKNIINTNITWYGGFYEYECSNFLKNFFKNKR